jgi:HSP20 family protein
MPVLKRQSLRDILYLQDRMNKIFEDSIKPVTSQASPQELVPPVDIYENDKSVTIKAELPGLNRDEIIIDISGNILSIGGRKIKAHDDKIDNYRVIERQYGSFKRTFKLPEGVDMDKISANFEFGVLEINLPKEKSIAARRVPISRD